MLKLGATLGVISGSMTIVLTWNLPRNSLTSVFVRLRNRTCAREFRRVLRFGYDTSCILRSNRYRLQQLGS